MEPPVLDEQLAANLVPLRATCSESVPAVELSICAIRVHSVIRRFEADGTESTAASDMQPGLPAVELSNMRNPCTFSNQAF